ncbi:type IV pilus assembly protein PilV [Caldimonas brevitalea]|uniref:Type IV pilus assembly protein PilV n=2 Tax=Caldimonas brevitalea TaxID=413882 RepID=A0A0G3BJC6_9BURK|nr:type IV pilus assembly protein PilV [Caldimonas brevitalea]
MIEVLISLVISAIGLGALIALQSRAYSAEAESYDRAQALMVLEDMVQRLNANRTQSVAYVSSAFGTATPPGDCDGAQLAARDLCEWNDMLTRLLPGARACITTPAMTSTGLPGREVRVTVVWRGSAPLAAPVATCAQADFQAQPALRRAVTAVVRFGNLAG